MKTSHCKKCEYSYRFSCGYQWFIGCKYPPYQGRWVKQINLCPKEQDPQPRKAVSEWLNMSVFVNIVLLQMLVRVLIFLQTK